MEPIKQKCDISTHITQYGFAQSLCLFNIALFNVIFFSMIRYLWIPLNCEGLTLHNLLSLSIQCESQVPWTKVKLTFVVPTSIQVIIAYLKCLCCRIQMVQTNGSWLPNMT
jgi:hypothetical protein